MSKCIWFACLGILTLANLFAAAEDIQLTKSSNLRPVGELMLVEPGQNYRLILKIEGKSGSLDVYLEQFNAQKRPMPPHAVNATPGTETVLTGGITRGATSFTVADASIWEIPKKGSIVVFDAQKDFSDLPNFEYEYYVKQITRKEGGYLVEMSKPITRNYPDGSLVRLHREGSKLGWKTLLPVEGAFQRMIAPAPAYGIEPNRWWRGTAFAQLLVRSTSDDPVVIKSWKLVRVSPAEITQHQKVAEVAELAEKQKLTPFGVRKRLKTGNGIEEFTNCYYLYRGIRHYSSGINQNNLTIPATGIRQFECDFKSRVPGVLELTLRRRLPGKEELSASVIAAMSVIPDGEYRRYIFDPFESTTWQPEGTLVSWSLGFKNYLEFDREIGFRNPEFKNERNLLAAAERWKAGTPEQVNGLRPLGKYKLEWSNGANPGVTIDFFDHLMRLIPNSRVHLAPGVESYEFTAPEPLIQSKITVNGTGQGYPRLTTVSAPMRYTPELFWRGSWIWSRNTPGPDYANVWFLREFDLDEVPDYAAMAIMADDCSDTYVNGVHVGVKTWPYRKAFRFDIQKQLKLGRNQIAIRVYNLNQAAGLCTDIYLKSAKKTQWLITDNNWKCKEVGKSETMPKAIDQPVMVLGHPATTSPWAAGVAFAYVGARGVFTLTKSENGEFTGQLANPAVSHVESMRFERRSASGVSSFFTLPVTLSKNDGGTVTVKYPKIRPTAETCKVFLDDDFWEISGQHPVAELPAVMPSKPGLKQAEFIDVDKRPKIKFNGKLHNPSFYVPAFRTPDGNWERLVPVLRTGFDSFVLRAEFDNFWLAENRYDFAKLDRDVEALLTICPEAIFMLDISFTMPNWWLKANPDDVSIYFEKTRRNTYDDRQALGSKNWLAAGEAPLKALLDHVKASHYADRIWGANIGDSYGNEWFWGGSSAGRDYHGKPAQPGYSPADLATFRAMLRKKYGTDAALAKAWNLPGATIDKAEMPDHNLRRQGAVGSLLSPEKNRQIMDWCYFRNQTAAEALLHFAARLKFHTERKWLVGAYYGYMVELSDNPRRSQLITGHNGFLDCAKSPDLDFVRAPSRYAYRRTGLPNGVMQAFSTFSLRGKVVYIENDERTAYGPNEGAAYNTYTGRGSTALESVGHINREFAMASALGLAHYWMNHLNGSLYEPALLDVIACQRKLFDMLPSVQGYTQPEVAVVGDVDSIYFSVDGNEGIFPPAVSGVFKHLNYLGVPFRNFVIGDLLDCGVVPSHKFYIMLPTLVLSKERREALLKRFAGEKATVLWLYSAGASYPEHGPKAEYCGDFLGIKCTMETAKQANSLVTADGNFESRFFNAPHFIAESGFDTVLGRDDKNRPLVVVKKLNGATHIFSTLPDLPRTFLGDLIGNAGVFRYVDRYDDPLWIGNDLVFLHAATSGEKRIRLPEGLKMRTIIGPLSGEFASNQPWNAEVGLTYGFLIEKQ